MSRDERVRGHYDAIYECGCRVDSTMTYYCKEHRSKRLRKSLDKLRLSVKSGKLVIKRGVNDEPH